MPSKTKLTRSRLFTLGTWPDRFVEVAEVGAPDFLVLPKADGPGHLHILDRLLTAAGRDTRLVESVRSLAAAELGYRNHPDERGGIPIRKAH